MKKKYPVLKCTKELWEEIRPVLRSFGITNFINISDRFDLCPYLLSNYGGCTRDELIIGNNNYSNIEITGSLRYLVKTKEEFLSAVAKLLGKEYNNNNNMEKRNIQIDKETARKWYNGNDNTLKELALQAYKEEELKESVIRTYQDLINTNTKIEGYYIGTASGIIDAHGVLAGNNNRNIAASKKVAKSMLAMAMISQLMPYYGGVITDEEWKSDDIKYNIFTLRSQVICGTTYNNNMFLAFHTAEQRDNFLKYNEQLVKDYLMID